MVKEKLDAFTLIELLVVIVIIGVLATISVAQFNGYQERARQAKSIAFASQAEKKLTGDAVLQSLGSFIAWDFEGANGQITDGSGNGNSNTFTVSSNLTFADDSPVGIGQSFEINETWLYENYSDTFRPTTNLTMSFFVKILNYSTSGGHNFMYFSSTGGLRTTSGGDFEFNFNNADPDIEFNTNIQIDKWYHILASYNGDTVTLYLDGDSMGTFDAPDNYDFSAYTNSFRIGPSTDQASGFSARIDRVRIYPIAYTPD